MKDYYQILGLAPGAGEEEIRKTYRRLALRYHPDRNPGDAGAEERFKEIAEAYGVLMDPVKRGQYERSRAFSGRRQAPGGFGYSQEEILRDLFRDPRFNQAFEDLFREFQRAGFRFDERFFDQTFFGGRGRVVGGVFVWQPFGDRNRERSRPAWRPPRQETEQAPAGAPLRQPSGWLRKLGRKVRDYLLGGAKALPAGGGQDLDLEYDLMVTPAAAREGDRVRIVIPRNGGQETLKVSIPAGTRDGARLRLRGKGRQAGSAVGDLYLIIHLG
jgi:curved DNA-binding protein